LENAAERPSLDEGLSKIEAAPFDCDVHIRIDDLRARSTM
jgi:hypothetical protein